MEYMILGMHPGLIRVFWHMCSMCTPTCHREIRSYRGPCSAPNCPQNCYLLLA